MQTKARARLLIVDDEAAHAHALCKILEREGYRTAGFASPREALAALADGEFDIVLTDLRMPEMDGISFFRKAHELDASLAIVMMTGEGSISTAVDAMKAGALDYIIKPFKLSALLPVLSRALEMRRLRVENTALEQSVRKRTQELTLANAELQSRTAEVERLNRLKSEFLASMSHELRTPLNAIIGFADLLAEQSAGVLNAKQERFIGHIQRGSRHLLALINELLDLAKIEAGRLELRLEDFSLVHALAEAVANTSALASTKQIEIELSTQVDVQLFADRVRFKQILYNLLSNAIKFTPVGGRVCIKATLENDWVVVSVTDTGVGIPSEEQAAIFGRFQQGLAGQVVFEGVGLGLAITKQLIELHGGRIWLESKPGGGTTFSFTFPTRLAWREERKSSTIKPMIDPEP